MSDSHKTYCDCSGSAPWPAMIRLPVGGRNLYHLCYECERVREDSRRPDGTIAKVQYHELASPTLSRSAKEQAEELLRLRGYRQGSLFDTTPPHLDM